MPDHANFISLIKGKVVVREVGKDSKDITFDNALMRVANNLVEIYIGVERVLDNESKASD